MSIQNGEMITRFVDELWTYQTSFFVLAMNWMAVENAVTNQLRITTLVFVRSLVSVLLPQFSVVEKPP